MNRQTLYRFVLVGLLLALLVVPVLGVVAQSGAAGNVFAEKQDHSITLQVEGTARPAAVIACTPPSSGNGCGGG